jgi:hypothetical protein
VPRWWERCSPSACCSSTCGPAARAGGVRPEGLVLPFTGLLDAVGDRWLHGRELVGMASTLSAAALAGAVLLRRRGPVELRWVLGLQLAFLTVCSGDVLGNDFGSTRSTLTLLAVALAALLAAPTAGASDRTVDICEQRSLKVPET